LRVGWESRSVEKFYNRLASFSRFILFDKRGTGLSDRVSPDKLPTLEERMDDVRAVMDAVGSNRAALFGYSEGAPMSVLFAATYPERTTALVLFGAFAELDFEGAVAPRLGISSHEEFAATIEERWGEGFPPLELWAPSIGSNLAAADQWARAMRMAASPTAAGALIRMVQQTDVRHVLPSIRVPTLILHRKAERIVAVDHARYLAAHIPGARYVELPGEDHLPWIGDSNAILSEIEEFLTGAKHEPELDRVLATVLFTDIVDATQRAASLGDDGWRDLLERHHAVVRRELERFRGREVDTAGDGFFATFDGPARAIRCACAISDAVKPLGLDLRAGLHTGECEIIGEKVGGIAVHIGARIASLALPGEVVVSSTVKDLVAGSGLRFGDRGTRSLKGVPGEWRLYSVER
jgi:class 3 adenylate cyclase